MSSILCSVSLAESYVKIAPVQRRLSELDETFLPPEEIEEGPHTTLTVQVQETYLFEEAIVKEVTPEPVVDLEEVRSRMNSEQTTKPMAPKAHTRPSTHENSLSFPAHMGSDCSTWSECAPCTIAVPREILGA